MITDPYKVLGVSPDASDDEIKAAYRKLAKRYHPDLHPGDEQAARKMKEINAAYEQIKNPQSTQGYGGRGSYQRPNSGYENPFGGFGGFGGFDGRQTGSASQEGNPQMVAAANYINAGYFPEALNALGQVPLAQRNGRWYYLSAVANANMGLKVSAMEHIRRAIQMEPNNMEYRRFLASLQNGAENYRQTGRS